MLADGVYIAYIVLDFEVLDARYYPIILGRYFCYCRYDPPYIADFDIISILIMII